MPCLVMCMDSLLHIVTGSTLAIYYLGKMHAFGIGVPKSCHTAVEVCIVLSYSLDVSPIVHEDSGREGQDQ